MLAHFPHKHQIYIYSIYEMDFQIWSNWSWKNFPCHLDLERGLIGLRNSSGTANYHSYF